MQYEFRWLEKRFWQWESRFAEFFGSFLIYFLSVKNLQAGHDCEAEMTHIQFVDLINH